MISIRQALAIQKDDTVFDFCGRNLKIKNYSVSYSDDTPIRIVYYCVDINTGALLYYSHREIYQNYEDLSDEDKIFLSWLRNKEECYTMCEDELLSLREAYLSGFSSGVSYTLKHQSEEQLQK